MPTVEDIINIGFSNHQNGKLSEAEYAYQLVDYFSNKKGFPFRIQLFTSIKTLKEYSVQHPYRLFAWD